MAIDLGLTLLAAIAVLAVIAAKRGEVTFAIVFFVSSYSFLLPLYIGA